MFSEILLDAENKFLQQVNLAGIKVILKDDWYNKTYIREYSTFSELLDNTIGDGVLFDLTLRDDLVVEIVVQSNGYFDDYDYQYDMHTYEVYFQGTDSKIKPLGMYLAPYFVQYFQNQLS